MKVLAILGSPRNNGNTNILLEETLKGIKNCTLDVTKYELNKLNVKNCMSCYKCGQKGICVFNDDMEKLYWEFDKSDIIIVASPLYFNSVSSLTKTMIDRCQALWTSKYILDKSAIDRNKKRKGIFICTAGSKQSTNGFIGAEVVMELFFKSINAEYYANLFVDNTDEENVSSKDDILDKAFNLGKSLCK